MTTLQWHPSLTYPDAYFGSAAKFAAGWADRFGGEEPSYYAAGAAAAVYTLALAMQNGLRSCELAAAAQGGVLDMARLVTNAGGARWVGGRGYFTGAT
jgi:hypothetical protein